MSDDVTGEPVGMDRPSSHGAALGRFLTRMMEAGGGAETCATCAFREGSLANQSAGTGLIAMHCAIGIDPAAFACHHGMKDGEPTMLCAGAIAAKAAPFEAWKAGISEMAHALPTDDQNDPIRIAFDQWREQVDPETRMDVYQLGRAYARRPGNADAQTPSVSS